MLCGHGGNVPGFIFVFFGSFLEATGALFHRKYFKTRKKNT